MTEEEAANLSRTLKGLLPATTPDQAFLLKREFLKLDALIVEAAIDAHAKVFPQVNIPRLLEQIYQATPSCARPGEQTRAQRQRVEAENKQVEAALSGLSSEELRACAQQAIDAADPATRRFLQNSDPQRSAVLRSLIYQRLSSAKSPATSQPAGR